MPVLLVRFAIRLKTYSPPNVPERHGPLFHRWLPNGKADSLTVYNGSSDVKLRVWFERWGYIDNTGSIQFDTERRELSDDIVGKWGVLDAGPLYGELKISHLSEEMQSCLIEDKVKDERYPAFVKDIASLIQQHVSRFLSLLRVHYGQYWIRQLEPWDSRKEPLVNYCDWQLNLRWSLDEGKTWKRFLDGIPREIRMTITVGERFDAYITKEDWARIGDLHRCGYEPGLAAITLGRAHELLDQGNLKHALIEGVSALELSINELFHRKFEVSGSFSEFASSFNSMPLKAQLVSMSTGIETIKADDIEHTIKAIDMRNDVVHEGWNPPDTANKELLTMFRTVGNLVSGHVFKFPTINPGNMRYP